MPLGMEIGLGPGDCVRWGPSSPKKKGTALAQFFAHGWIKTPLGTVVNLNAGNVGIAAPPKTGTAPLAHVYGGQTAGWMKTPLGTEVDLSPGHIVLNGDPAPPCKRGTAAPALFSTHVYCGHGHPSQLLLSSCLNITSAMCRP